MVTTVQMYAKVKALQFALYLGALSFFRNFFMDKKYLLLHRQKRCASSPLTIHLDYLLELTHPPGLSLSKVRYPFGICESEGET